MREKYAAADILTWSFFPGWLSAWLLGLLVLRGRVIPLVIVVLVRVIALVTVEAAMSDAVSPGTAKRSTTISP